MTSQDLGHDPTDAEVFEEWQRQWLAEPERFATHDDQLATEPRTYGEQAADTFARIRRELEES